MTGSVHADGGCLVGKAGMAQPIVSEATQHQQLSHCSGVILSTMRRALGYWHILLLTCHPTSPAEHLRISEPLHF
ncbi:hypothetical protein R3P38DRAFT_3221648 [Favolaschia claudopus]|uniref:Uncharacterized protein n=1 Tax=Favolaschia claudopus TaxID=2862362 RepID=A0AAV9ZZV3_9AGAR